MRKWLILAIALCCAAAIDQAAKGWALANLQPYQSAQPIPALAPLFQLTLTTNTGAAFGILPMAGDLFLLLAVVIVAGLLWTMRSTPADARLLPIATGLVIGGALGNIIDRVQHGHVIDFIHYQIPDVISNVSNPADHAIVLGVALIIAENLWRSRRG